MKYKFLTTINKRRVLIMSVIPKKSKDFYEIIKQIKGQHGKDGRKRDR